LGAALIDAMSQATDARSFRNVPSFDTDDVTADVRWQLQRLRAIGIERVVAVDLTRPDMGIPVVRLVIPGLEWDCTHRDYHPGPRAQRASAQHARAQRAAVVPHECCHFCRPLIAASVAAGFAGIEWRPPVRQGDVYLAALSSPAIIGIIDGYFEIVPTVWHKEILWAMDRGIHVYGGASIGALRAAELADFGMTGIGQIYEQYRAGQLTDDDEVAVCMALRRSAMCRSPKPWSTSVHDRSRSPARRHRSRRRWRFWFESRIPFLQG